METEKNISILNRIARGLMLHGSFINNLGLLNGKLGICIFFYKYAQFTQKKHYSEFADELIDEIYSEINFDYPRNFKDGLSGICWGMEYIIRNKYVDADANEVLSDLDIQILERDIRRVTDVSFETGLNGLAHYVLARCVNNSPNPYIPREYIIDLTQALQNHQGDKTLIIHLTNLIENKPIYYPFDLLDQISIDYKYKEEYLFQKYDIGIVNNGLTGIALNLLNKIKKT